MKSIFDLILSILILVLCTPLLVIITLIIWMETLKNPFYIQKRGVTLEYRFKIYKFRTLLDSSNSQSKRIFYKVELSDQVTKTGRILRITGLDELPQLINVIRGEMSLIGPRPLSINDLLLLKENETEIYNRREKLKSKPGISGMWQVYADRERGAENLIELDELYEKQNNIFTDLSLLAKTIPLVLGAKHSDSIVSNSAEYQMK